MCSGVKIGANPPLIGMIGRPNSVPRHTLENIRETGVYSLNLIHESFLEQAHQTSARYSKEVSEFQACKISSSYKAGFYAPFIEASEMSLLMELREVKDLEINSTLLVIGELREVILRNSKALKEDGFIDFGVMGAAACVGLDAYTFPDRFTRKEYAKAK